MIATIALFQILAAPAAVPGEIDRACLNGYCNILAVQNGRVRLLDSMRNLIIGHYVEPDQHLVPQTEAPVRDLRSKRGWRIVVSAFLDHGEESEAGLRARFFAPDGTLTSTDEFLMDLEDAEIGYLFGGSDEIVAVTSYEEHVYNVQTDIWLLPKHGNPTQLIEIVGTLGMIVKAGAKATPGVWIRRQTYDGVHAETKGWVNEFWIWAPRKKSLKVAVARSRR